MWNKFHFEIEEIVKVMDRIIDTFIMRPPL